MANSSCTSMLDSECSAHRNRLTQETPTNNPRDKNSPPGAQHRRIGRPRRGPRTLSEQDRRPSAGLECLNERMNSSSVQRASQRCHTRGRIGRRREPGEGRPGCGREFRWDLRGPRPRGGGGGQRSTRGSRAHHAIGTRGGRPEPRPPGRAELYTAAYCARAVIISPLQAAAGRPWVAAAYG